MGIVDTQCWIFMPSPSAFHGYSAELLSPSEAHRGHNTSVTSLLLSSMNTVNNALSIPALCQSCATAWGKRESAPLLLQGSCPDCSLCWCKYLESKPCCNQMTSMSGPSQKNWDGHPSHGQPIVALLVLT